MAGVGNGVSELRGVAGVVVTGRAQPAAAGRAGRGAGAVRPCHENIISIFGVAIIGHILSLVSLRPHFSLLYGLLKQLSVSK